MELDQKQFVSKNFEFAFGQHSGVIDLNKDKFELPRFPINEKYGDMERFKFIVNLLPFQYKKVYPEEKMIENNNPPDMKVEFLKNNQFRILTASQMKVPVGITQKSKLTITF